MTPHRSSSRTRAKTRSASTRAAHCEVLIDFNEIHGRYLGRHACRQTRAAEPHTLHEAALCAFRLVVAKTSSTCSCRTNWMSSAQLACGRRCGIFSLADLTNPSLAGTWTGPTTAIDHNGFVRGNRYYMSNYTSRSDDTGHHATRHPIQVGRLTPIRFRTTRFRGRLGSLPVLCPAATSRSATLTAASTSPPTNPGCRRRQPRVQRHRHYAATKASQAPLSVARVGGARVRQRRLGS